MTLPTWFPELKDVVLFALALWGAVLSTINWRKAEQRDRRSLKVEAGTAMLAGETLGQPYAQIKATNVGHRTVMATSFWFELPNATKLVSRSYLQLPGMTDTQLPATLSDGQSAQMWMSYEDIGNTLAGRGTDSTTLHPVCEDSTGQRHRGDPWTVNAAEFIRMGRS